MGKLLIQPSSLEEFVYSGQVSISAIEIVQELIDNSIDAGSTHVNICLVDGNILQIIVEDNGCGIEDDDSELICSRGFSSKTQSVPSLGYKGEALFSVSRICSSLEIYSKTENSKGFYFSTNIGVKAVPNLRTITGTKIIVNDPFFNHPVRKIDWQKRRNYYANQIQRAVIRFSLSFSVRFRLKFSWTDEFDYTSVVSDSCETRIFQNLGAKTIHHLLGYVENYECDCYLLNDPNLKMVYINKRHTSLKYGTLYKDYGHILFVQQIDSDYLNCSSKGTNAGKSLFHPSYAALRLWIENELEKVMPVDSQPAKIVARAKYTSQYSNFNFIRPCEKSESFQDTLHPSDIEMSPIIGQYNNGFILCQIEDQLLIIDQHAADERVFYEAFKNLEIQSSSQKLVAPKLLDLEYEYVQALKNNEKFLVECGFDFIFSDLGISLTSVPLVSGTAFTESDLKQMLALESSGRGSLDSFFATKACKSAVRICQTLNEQTMRRILSQLSAAKNPWACAHGRNSACIFSV